MLNINKFKHTISFIHLFIYTLILFWFHEGSIQRNLWSNKWTLHYEKMKGFFKPSPSGVLEQITGFEKAICCWFSKLDPSWKFFFSWPSKWISMLARISLLWFTRNVADKNEDVEIVSYNKPVVSNEESLVCNKHHKVCFWINFSFIYFLFSNTTLTSVSHLTPDRAWSTVDITSVCVLNATLVIQSSTYSSSCVLLHEKT